jgi:predicted flavoprotein YhiN
MKIYTVKNNRTLKQKYPLLSHFEISRELMGLKDVMTMINNLVTSYKNSNVVLFEECGVMIHAYFLKYENDDLYEDIKNYVINIIGKNKYEDNFVFIGSISWDEDLYNEYKKMGHELIRLQNFS